MVEQLVNVLQMGTVLVAGRSVGVARSVEGWLPPDIVAVMVVGGTVVATTSCVCVKKTHSIYDSKCHRSSKYFTQTCMLLLDVEKSLILHGCTCLLQLGWALS